MESKQIRNIALIGSVAVGKTTLVDSMLFEMKAIESRGSSEAGNLTTDYDPDEIKRQMSIATSLATGEWKGHKINILDTPGHSDFLVDTRLSLMAVDSAVLVIDSSRGVDVNTQKIYQMAKANNIPVAIVVNKYASDNAKNYFDILTDIHNSLDAHAVPMLLPNAKGASYKGNADLVTMQDIPAEVQEDAQKFRTTLVEGVAEQDDALLEKYLGGGELSDEEIVTNFRKGVREGNLAPIMVSSGKDNIGVRQILDAITNYLPSPLERNSMTLIDPDSDTTFEVPALVSAPAVAFAFKTISDPYVGKVTIFRVYAGEVKTDDNLFNPNRNSSERMSRPFTMIGKKQIPMDKIVTGDIGAVAKLKDTQTGDTLLSEKHHLQLPTPRIPQPIFAEAISPKAKGDEAKLAVSLGKLRDEDPSFEITVEPRTHRTKLSAQGQTHLDILVDRLKSRFHVEVDQAEPQIPYRETVRHKAEGQGRHKKQSGGRGQFGDCWLRIEPLPSGEGFKFIDAVVGGSVPRNYIPAVEKGVREILEEGILAGYPIVDCSVTLYFGSYHAVDSSEMAFKVAAHIAMKKIFAEADPFLLEPIMATAIAVPEEAVGDTMSDLNTRRAQVEGMDTKGNITTIKAKMPLAEVAGFIQSLKSFTRGQGSLDVNFSHYQEVPALIQQQVLAEVKKEQELAAKG
ncbi:MAG TPA: elongation factor G [Cyanobacteria bacterium UBA8530]|nr:elongation factor G [Cyanobacteria bacterium UBA8530]